MTVHWTPSNPQDPLQYGDYSTAMVLKQCGFTKPSSIRNQRLWLGHFLSHTSNWDPACRLISCRITFGEERASEKNDDNSNTHFNSTTNPPPHHRHAVPTGPPISQSRRSSAGTRPVLRTLLCRCRRCSRRQAPSLCLRCRRHICHRSGTITPILAAQLYLGYS
jgi:hypothetical protein